MVTAVCAGLGAAFGGSSEIPKNLGLLDIVEGLYSKEENKNETVLGLQHYTKGAPDVLSFLPKGR